MHVAKSTPHIKTSQPQTIPLAYAGKWIAWIPDGMRIVAVGDTFALCESAAALAGFPEVAVECVPAGRQRLTGSGI